MLPLLGSFLDIEDLTLLPLILYDLSLIQVHNYHKYMNNTVYLWNSKSKG